MAAAALLFALVGLTVPTADEVADALAELSAPDAGVRRAAERALAAGLTPGDLAAVAEVALAGDAEVRQRLARAVGARDANAPLFAQLLADGDPELATLGGRAAREAALRWLPGLEEAPLTGDSLARALERRRDRAVPELLLLSLDAPLAEVLERLVRLSAVPIAVTVDPDLALIGASPQGGSPGWVRGTWDEVLLLVAQAYGVEACGMGFQAVPPPEDAPVPWVSLRPKNPAGGGADALRTGAADLVDWCARALGAEDPAQRRAAALALAGSAWPAALGLLADRVRTADDGAALDGVLLAAGRGRVDPLLLDPRVVEALAAQADLGFDGRGPVPAARAVAVQRALQRLPARGPGGEDLVGAILSGFAQAGPRGRWWRLCVLEGIAPRGAPAREAARAVLLAPSGSQAPPLLLQALRTLVAVGGADGVPPLAADAPVDLDGLLGGPRGHDGFRDLASLLAASGLAPPADLADPAGVAALPGPPLARGAVLLEWWLARGDSTAVARLLPTLPGVAAGFPPLAPLSDPAWPPQGPYWQQSMLGGILAEWVQAGRVETVAGAFGQALAAADDPRTADGLARLAVLARALPAGREAELGDLALELGRHDPLLLAALAGTPRWGDAAERLLDLVARALSPGAPLLEVELCLAGVVEAESELRAVLADDEAGALRAHVQEVALANREGARYVRFLLPWQTPPRMRLSALSRRDRPLDPSLPPGR